ncbi:MAG: hypothetical protein HQL19_03370, partial [Candidatus Omnitrophica bacterium]|nr:hypothetical protein [Candidatus Omnitrophota bacterium]
IFFTTPPRKKFLQSDQGELDQALHVFLPYTLLFPSKRFVLTHNGRTILDVAPVGSFEARAAKVLNLEARHVIGAHDLKGAEGAGLRLVLGDINIQRPRRDAQFLFVNGRPVQSKNLLFHVNDMYRLIMPNGVHPFFIVFLEVPGADVDVNIHPSKREVRLRQEGRLGAFIRAEVERLLMTKSGAREAAYTGPDIFTFDIPAPSAEILPHEQGIPPERMIFNPLPQGGETVFLLKPGERVQPPVQAPELSLFAREAVAKKEGSVKDRLGKARWLGTFAQKYHLFEEGDGLFAVDQHAAQERILFEKFRAQILAGKVEVQHLLTPLAVRLTPSEKLTWERRASVLAEVGFEATFLDDQALALQAHPALLKDPEHALRALLGEDMSSAPDHDMLARRACRASVMAGARMAPEAAAGQLKALLLCDDPFTCPHGRPVFIELKTSFLDKQFMRI